MEIENYLNERKRLIDSAIDSFLPPADAQPAIIHEAMRYSALDGGKRIRPILTLTAAEAVGGSIEDALPAACAIEMIHAFSLIHDDLPCMDDDDLRRGKPTSHKVFGEALALLAGDALFALAFETIARTPAHVPPDVIARVFALVASASGTSGMVGGQVLDLLAEGKKVGIEQVEGIHRRKTGELIRASVLVGGEIGGADAAQMTALDCYGEQIGLAFQIVDDILDIEGEEAVMGKKVGADSKLGKATYPAVLGLEESRIAANKAAAAASEAAASIGADRLLDIASFIVSRDV